MVENGTVEGAIFFSGIRSIKMSTQVHETAKGGHPTSVLNSRVDRRETSASDQLLVLELPCCSLYLHTPHEELAEAQLSLVVFLVLYYLLSPTSMSDIILLLTLISCFNHSTCR